MSDEGALSKDDSACSIRTYTDALVPIRAPLVRLCRFSGSLSSMSGVQAVLDGPPGGLLGRLDLPGEVLHQPPQQLRLDLEPIFAAARRGGVGDMLDDCCTSLRQSSQVSAVVRCI